jgi:ubiquinone/menaquinone biosynthesis C-methylase UbiE
LDLLVEAPGRVTRYQDDDFPIDPAYTRIGPALMGAAVRLWMLRRLLQPQEGERLLDAGCGNGKFAFWLHRNGVKTVGVDVAAHFAFEAIDNVDLVRADARRLPFEDRSFSAAYSIDVLEHLDRPSIDLFLSELHRVLIPEGRLFLYSNTRERSTLWPLMAPSRVLHNTMIRTGLVDDTWDRLRKDDHVKALTSIDDVIEAITAAGFSVQQVVYWNTVLNGILENVVVKLARAIITRGQRPRDRAPWSEQSHFPPVLAKRKAYFVPLWALTQLSKLDVCLFGRLRAGPFFLLARKVRGRNP